MKLNRRKIRSLILKEMYRINEEEEGIDIDNPIDLEFARVVHTNLHLHRG